MTELKMNGTNYIISLRENNYLNPLNQTPMKYNSKLSIFLGVLLILSLCLANNMEGFNTPPTKEKATTPEGKDTLITVKK